MICNNSYLLAFVCIITIFISSSIVAQYMTNISFAQPSNNSPTQTTASSQLERSSISPPSSSQSLIQLTAGKVQDLSFVINGGYNAAGTNPNTIVD
jgi:hypothetical protein